MNNLLSDGTTVAGLHQQVPLNGWWDSEPDRACHGEFILSHHPFKGFFVGVRKLKWFKHDSNANMDAKLKRLKMRYGMEGYGLYWYCLEIIADNVDQNNYTFELTHDAEIIAFDTGIHKDQVQETMRYMVELELFESSNGIITCLKMAKRLDQSMTSNPNLRKIIKNNHDGVMTLSGQNRIEENRIEESKGKNGKRFIPPSIEDIKKYCHEKNKEVDAEQFCNFYESKGWYVGKNKMKSWKHAVALWHSRNKTEAKPDPREYYV